MENKEKEDKKICPKCKKLIKRTDRVCVHCGYDYILREVMGDKEEKERMLNE